MTEALVVTARDMGQLAQLARRQHPVWNRDTQHVGVELQVDAVHQPMQLELVFRELPAQAPADLVAKLGDPFGHELRVEFIVAVHGRRPW